MAFIGGRLAVLVEQGPAGEVAEGAFLVEIAHRRSSSMEVGRSASKLFKQCLANLKDDGKGRTSVADDIKILCYRCCHRSSHVYRRWSLEFAWQQTRFAESAEWTLAIGHVR